MESSPLVQQARPSFKPKISQLYEELFVDQDDAQHTEGYWNEFFLLKPDRSSLQQRLESVTAEDLLHFQEETKELFSHAIQYMKLGRTPSDQVALDTLTVFLGGVLSKRFTNPSADIITVLTGLDKVDPIFSEFANVIETVIRNGRSLKIRKKAIEVSLSLTSGAYQTSLVSYFTHRDLFPALMRYIQEVEKSGDTFEPFLLLGLLANYNRFEYRNPYRARMEDFVNESSIQKLLYGFRNTCKGSRNRYVAILDDVPHGWSLSSALTAIGLGILAPVKAIAAKGDAEDEKESFDTLPAPESAIILASYDFANANKLFCYNLIACPAETKTDEAPFSAFLSLTSYILHHAYRSPRATLYAILNLSILRIIIEDVVLCKRLCGDDSQIWVRLCRQRQPFLPTVTNPRPAVAQILDITIDTINHNLRRRLDVDLYVASIALIHRILCCLSQTQTRLAYHWALLWQTLLALLRFLTTYAADLLSQTVDMHCLIDPLMKTLALAVRDGNSFLPDHTIYDDLFYKLVANYDVLVRFKSAYSLSPTPSTDTIASPEVARNAASRPIDVLTTVSLHYNSLLEEEKAKGTLSKNPSPREVSKIIRGGFETLVIPEVAGLDSWDKWREGEEKGLLKKIGRLAVEDTRRLLKVTQQ